MQWLVFLALVTGCLPKQYHCASDSECGANGACEPTGFCAYADSSCASGMRYGDLSGSYSHVCIGDTIDGDAPFAPDAPGDTAPDAPPPDLAFVQQVDPGYARAATIAVPITLTAGNFLIAATYANIVGTAVTISDTATSTWTPLTAHEMTGCAPRLQLFYTTVAASGADTVTVSQTGATALGVHLVEYSGVIATPIEVESGQVAPAASNALSPPALSTTHKTTIVALFGDLQGVGTMTAGTGWTQRGLDTQFYTILVDNAPGADAGTYTPTANLPGTTSDACWTAAAVALR
jgi:hypothetical protein